MTIFTSANSKNGNSSAAAPTGGPTAESMVFTAGHPVPQPELHKTRERIVGLMMVLVAAAAGAVFHMHLGYSVLGATAAGFIVFAGFLAMHTLKKRAAQIGRLRHDVSRLEQELGRLRSTAPAATKAGSAAGTGSPTVEAGSAKAKSAPASKYSPAESKRTAPSNSLASPPPASGPQVIAPGNMASSFPDGAPERISPDARWEAPDLARAGKTAEANKSAAIAQGLAPTLSTMKTDRTSGSASPSGSPRPAALSSASELFEAPSWSGTSISSTDPLRDAWSFRPKDAVEAPSFAPDAGAAEERALRMTSPPGTPVENLNSQTLKPRGIEADLELVQRKIKAMAEEVNAAESARLMIKPATDPHRAASPAAAASTTMNAAGAGYTPVASDFGTAAMAIEDGISALRSAAGTMRSPAAAQPALKESAQAPASAMLPAADLLIPSTAQTIAVSAPPAPASPTAGSGHFEMASAAPPPRAPETRMPENRMAEARAPETKAPEIRDSRVSEIAKAIEAKNMDVLLSPIVGLGDYAVTHFEVVVRLLGADGTHYDRPEEALTLAGSHLLALFDAERLSRTAAVAELLESRGKNGAVLTAATGASMSDAGFLETFARVYETRNAISGQLVLTFSQADIEAFGSGTWQALSDMHSFGFRFALDRVTHLGMDFEYLAQCGFTFVKLPAQVFLKGLPADAGFITVNDICRHLARCGLTLVVESVDDEALLAKVFGFGALFGQGQLFGAPRQISLDTLAPAQSAAA